MVVYLYFCMGPANMTWNLQKIDAFQKGQLEARHSTLRHVKLPNCFSVTEFPIMGLLMKTIKVMEQ